VTACVIDWAAFGLEDPGDTGCIGEPIVEISQGCMHEHIATARVCYACCDELTSYADPAEWTCGPCVRAGHNCAAPLQFRELGKVTS
jgi:hypothetical protein